MERMVRGRIHGADTSVRSPTRHGHYTLSRPEFEERSFLNSDSDSGRFFGNGDKGYYGQSRQSRRLSEFNESFSRGNPTSSKFEWEQLLARSEILGSAESYGIAATTMTTERTYYGGRFSNSSQFGTTLLDKSVSMGLESQRFSSPCHLDVGVPRSSGNVYGCSFVMPSRRMTSGHQTDEDFWIRNQAHLDKPSRGQVFEKQDNLEVYFKDPSVHTKPGSKLKEFGMGLQKDAFHGSFSEGLHFPSYGSGLSPELVAMPIGLRGLGIKSIESHVDPHNMRSNDRSNPPVDPPSIPSSDGRSNPLVVPPSMRSSDKRSNHPHGDFSSNEGKLVDYTSTEDHKRVRGNMGIMSDIFYGNMASFGEEYADPDFVRAKIGDRIVDSNDECSPKAHLKNTRPGDHVSPSIEQLNTCYIPASGSLHSKGQEREVTGYRSTLLHYQDAYEKSGRLLSVDEHRLKRDRLEMLAVTDRDSCLDGVDGSFELQLGREKMETLPVRNSDSCLDGLDGRFEQRLPAGDSLGNILKRKDGVADEQHLFVSKKSRCNLPQDKNAGKSSNETACHRTTDSDNHGSKLDKSSGIYSRDISKCLGTDQNVIVTSSLNKQKPTVEKRLGPSPQNISSTHSSVNKKKHSVKKQRGPAPKKVKLCPQGFQNQKAGNFTQKIQDGADGAHGQEGDSLKGNSIPAKTERPHVPPPQVKNQTPGKFTKTIQDGPDGAHSQEGDSSKCNTTPAKSVPPHVSLPQVKNQIPDKFTKRIRDGRDGAPSKEGNSSKGNATPAKTEPPHVRPSRVKNQKAGKFTKRIRDGPRGAHTVEPAGIYLSAADEKKFSHSLRSKEGDSTKGNATPAKTKPPHASPGAKKENAGKLTKGLGDAPDGVHGEMDDSPKGKVTPAKSEPLHVTSPVVKIQKSGKLNRAPDGAHDQNGDSLKGNVTRVRTEPPENSKDFKQRLHSAFLKFVKQLNENSAHWRNFMEQGKAGHLKCNICGSKSEEFVDMESLTLHTFTSPTVEYRSLHLGFHKALCLAMGWKSAMAFNSSSSWICETLPDAEASALKEDFIIWPPVAIIHNSSTQNNNPDERVVVTSEMLQAVLKNKGFGEKIKVGRGRPGNQSIMVVKFSGTLSGLQEAERLHSFYAETKHGRSEFQRVTDSESSTTCFKLENILYGYLGVAEDLDKLDFETKKRCLVKSKQEIQNIADAF